MPSHAGKTLNNKKGDIPRAERDRESWEWR